MTSSHLSVRAGESHSPFKRLLSRLDSPTLRLGEINSPRRVNAAVRMDLSWEDYIGSNCPITHLLLPLRIGFYGLAD
ncbi:hypothetical protein HNY73_003422 [Argiope bruennichi]|uniref:Uncharacterized protein n=1 Tax=Argiope bruennichi TaxID=94029 RepID=A0A8T0FKI8_ARGBR|nr:hypothetical protein HNY73_003422 [Argiope bruennichi]